MMADDDIAQLRELRPEVVRLARAVSLAARADVALVRRLRHELLPTSDVSLEHDLWNSTLIQLRGEAELRLRSDVTAQLWEELHGEEPDGRGPGLDEIWRVLDAAREGAQPLLRLEERLTYLGIKRDLLTIEAALRGVIAAMRDHEERRRDLAGWAARALARLPPVVRESESARILAAAARGWVATPTVVASLSPRDPENAVLAGLLAPPGPRVSLAIRRVGDVLEVGGPATPASVSIDLPAGSNELIIDVGRVEAVEPAAITRLPVSAAEVMLGSVDGRRWLLGPADPVPDMDAICRVKLIGDRVRILYLVTPQLAVTSAVDLHAGWAATLLFGTNTVTGTVAALDSNADLAVIALDRPVPVPPVVLDLTGRQGARWHARIPRTTIEPAGAWQGTIATAWPALTLHAAPAADGSIPFVPGTPIFCGTRVVGHLRGSHTGGVLSATPAHLVKWWVEQSRAAGDRDLVTLRFDGRDQTRLGVVVYPDIVVCFDAPDTSAIVDGGMHRVRAELGYRVGAVTAFALDEPWPEHTLAIADGDHDGDVLVQSLTGRWPARSSHVSKDAYDVELSPIADRPPRRGDAVLDDRRVALLGFLDDPLEPQSTIYSVTRIPAEVQAWTKQRARGSRRRRSTPKHVWITSVRSGQLGAEGTFQTGEQGQVDDRLVVFVSDPTYTWPGGIYDVVRGQRLSGSAEVIARRVLDLPRPDEKRLASQADVLRSLAGATSQRDTRSLGIHDQLVAVLSALHQGSPVVAEIRRLLGVTETAPVGRPVVINLPEDVSVAGLLGVVVEHDGPVRRLRGHRWLDHVVHVTVGEDALNVEGSLRVLVRTQPGEVFGPAMMVTISAGAPFTARMVEQAASSLLIEVEQRARTRAGPLLIVVNTLPGMSNATALRHGVRFVTALLVQLDELPFATVRVVQIAGAGGLDLAVAQEHARRARPTFNGMIAAIDPENDLIEVMAVAPSDRLTWLAEALDLRGRVRIVERHAGPFAGRFGGVSMRNGRKLTLRIKGLRVDAEVAATAGPPIRGYVSFYVPGEPAAGPLRVRATDGVARARFSRTFAGGLVGAVIEDESTALENRLPSIDWTASVGRIVTPGVSGTCFLVSDRFVITAHHLLDETEPMFVRLGNDEPRVVSPVVVDPAADWAVLRFELPTGRPPLPLGRAEPPLSCQLFGFPSKGESRGVTLTGTVRETGGPNQLVHLEESRVDDLVGLSGAPCVVDNHVIGLVLLAVTNQGGGHNVVMLPIERVLQGAASELRRGGAVLLDNQEPS